MTSRQLFTIVTMFVLGVFGYAALAPSPASHPARFATEASASPSPTGPPRRTTSARWRNRRAATSGWR